MSDLAARWVDFADSSCGGYSPLYDRICRAVAASPEVLGVVAGAPRHAHRPNVLLAAVHFLVLGGDGGPLTDLYAGTSGDDPGAAFVEFVLERREALDPILARRHTNTNEVGRSALLGPLLRQVADGAGEPLALVDVGCSAGLNLLCDRYLLDYGPAGTTGPPDAAVRVECRVTGGRPPIKPGLPSIAARVGIDRDPVDLSDEEQFRWQLALVWPDTGRLERTRRALEEARRADLPVLAGDAVDVLADAVRSLPPGCHPVVVTTWAATYLSPERRHAFSDRLADLGRERPITWVSGEPPGVVPPLGEPAPLVGDDGTHGHPLGIVSYAGGDVDARVVADAHPHGWWIAWAE